MIAVRSSMTVEEALDFLQLREQTKEIIPPACSVSEAVHALVRSNLYIDAVRILALILPPRDAIAWAWDCAQKSGEHLTLQEKRAIELTKEWISAPSDEIRRAAFEAGEQAGLGTPAGCLATAVFMGEGSIAPIDVTPVPPPFGVCAQLVSGSITLSAVLGKPEHASEKLRAYLEGGLRGLETPKDPSYR